MPRMTTTKEENQFLQAVIGNGLLETSIQWIQENMYPEDVFTPAQLAAWAEAHDYVDADN